MLCPSNVQVWWLSLAIGAVALTCLRRHWAGLWLGGMLVAGGWAYTILAPASRPPGYYAIMEFLAGVTAVAAGVLVTLLGAAYVVHRKRPGAGLGVIAAACLAGSVVGYFGVLLTEGTRSSSETATNRTEVWLRVFDVTVYHEVGTFDDDLMERAHAYRDRVVLPVCTILGAVAGLIVGSIGWVGIRRSRQRSPNSVAT